MEFEPQIAALRWPGWRRYGPAAGSAAFHLMALAGLAAMLATSPGFDFSPAPLAVSLVSDMAPPPRLAPEPRSAPIPTPASPLRRREGTPAPSAPAIAPGAATPDDADAVALPPPLSIAPPGLRSLLAASPCSQVIEKLRNDCAGQWASLAAESAAMLSPRLEAMAKLYPGFTRSGPSAAWLDLHYGQRPQVRNWLAGGHIMKPVGVMPGGPAGGTGIESITGRLPPKNWQHQDPMFGTQDPSWLP